MVQAFSSPSAVVYGCEGETLNEWEKGFFKEINPLGFILFARNCKTPQQVHVLTQQMRELLGREDVIILIDQEGGRVTRLRPPHWRAAPPAKIFSDIASMNMERAKEAVYLNARLIAEELYQLGINVNCAPLADVLYPDAHDIIGDRAFGETPEQIAVLGRSMAQGLMDGGVIPVLKHIPGHGRALVDSHEALPTVTATRAELETLDFKPFKALADLPMGMTAHIIYTAIDAAHAATVSPKVIELVRRDIGFDGLLFSDDLSMKALTGSFEERTRATLAAGCDVVLHCNGQREEMEAIARANPVMTPAAMQRFVRALKSANHQATTLMADYESRLQQLIQAA